MSEAQFNGAYRIGYGDGRYEAIKGTAKSNSIWFLAGVLIGLSMSLATYLASKGGI